MAALNDEQVMLRDMAREWADNESPETAYRKLRNEARLEGHDPAAWSAQGEMGWAGIVVPEEFGGSAFGWLSLGLVLEQLGRNLSASPLAGTACAAAAWRPPSCPISGSSAFSAASASLCIARRSATATSSN